jgi:hypothetical protein
MGYLQEKENLRRGEWDGGDQGHPKIWVAIRPFPFYRFGKVLIHFRIKSGYTLTFDWRVILSSFNFARFI